VAGYFRRPCQREEPNRGPEEESKLADDSNTDAARDCLDALHGENASMRSVEYGRVYHDRIMSRSPARVSVLPFGHLVYFVASQ
jgi:hypothetical protein